MAVKVKFLPVYNPSHSLLVSGLIIHIPPIHHLTLALNVRNMYILMQNFTGTRS